MPEQKEELNLSGEEKGLVHAVAESLRLGEGFTWSILGQLKGPNFPNNLSKEQCIILAVDELVDQDPKKGSLQARVPEERFLTTAEKEVVRQVREKLLGGREIDWDNLENKWSNAYPHHLRRRPYLAIAASQIKQLTESESDF